MTTESGAGAPVAGTDPPLMPAPNRIGDPYRLQVVADLGFRGQDADVHLDAVLRTLAAACDISIAALNIVAPGRQVFAAELGVGMPCAALPDELNFCAGVVASGRPLVISDVAHHAVLRQNPFVLDGTIGAYAGEPVSHRGVVVGALAIYARGAREFSTADLVVLHEQARLVEMILELRVGTDHTNAVMLRSLVDHSESVIDVRDLQGRYLLANPRAEQLWSATEAEVLGRTAAQLDHLDLRRLTDESPDPSATHEYEQVVELADGPHVYESVTYPLTDAAGRVYATAGVSLDVTAQRRVAEAVAGARDAAMAASRQKSSFLATMSHEIRTPLNAVIGMTGLLLDTALDGEQREFVRTVRSSGEALLSIINDILDFSKIEAGGLRLEHRPFDLRDCVERAVEVVAAGPRSTDVELVVDVDRRCPRRVVGDVTRLGHVLVNLLGNAAKFTLAGEVLVRVEPADSGGAPSDGPALRFTVTDTGIGIPADRLGGLFDSFSQVDASTTRVYGGTGLGLAISSRLVTAMGGVLTVGSILGTGSTFSFAVDLEDAGSAPAAQPAGPAAEQVCADEVAQPADRAAAPLSLRVLLAEDNLVNQRICRLMLEKLGHRVDVVGNGREAAAAVTALPYDAILMDVQMPVLDGLEATRLIRSRPSPGWYPQIVALTASALVEDRAACLAAGMDDHLGKPIRLGDLDAALRRAAERIGRGQARPGSRTSVRTAQAG